MGKRDDFIKDIKYRCCHLYDQAQIKEFLLEPFSEHIQHDAIAITGVRKGHFDQRAINYGYPSQFLVDYFKVKVGNVPNVQEHLKKAPVSGHSTSVEPPGFKKSPDYLEFFEPYGFEHGLQTFYFDSTGHVEGVFGITRKASKPFNDDEIELFDHLAPYVFYAFLRYRWLLNIEFYTSHSIEELLFGVIITDKKGRITWRNGIAERLLLDSSGNELQYIPDEFNPMMSRIEQLLRGKKNIPDIFTELESPSPYGNVVCMAVDENSRVHLPTDEDGMLFLIEPKQAAILKLLSIRETEVLRCMVRGMQDKEIAATFFISQKTVQIHARNIFTKLGASNRTEAAMIGVNLKLV